MPVSVKPLLKTTSSYKVAGSLWIECEHERFFGPGRVELLEHIAETGSISKAAQKMGMSYKKAWEMINKLNMQTVRPVVTLQSGGIKGGGTILTEEAWELIKYHRHLRKRFAAFLEKETKQLKK
jgi:molybdate transport system regulatory protein